MLSVILSILCYLRCLINPFIVFKKRNPLYPGKEEKACVAKMPPYLFVYPFIRDLRVVGITMFYLKTDVASVVTLLIRRQHLVSTALTRSINADVYFIVTSVDIDTRWRTQLLS